MKNGKVSYFEICVGEHLRSVGIELIDQVGIKKWFFDYAVKGTNILIEADGDYWHSMQASIERDRRKDEWCIENGYELYRVKERDFIEDKDMACRKIIDRVLQPKKGSKS